MTRKEITSASETAPKPRGLTIVSRFIFLILNDLRSSIRRSFRTVSDWEVISLRALRIFPVFCALSVSFAALQAEEAPLPVTPKSVMEMLGPMAHPVTTKSKKAHGLFNQGLIYIYALNYSAAVDSFQKALEYDPDMAMAMWGTAFALVNAENGAQEQIQKAVETAKKTPISDNEKAYIEALAVRYRVPKGADKEGYYQAMKKLVEKYPEDLDAQALYAASRMDLYSWKLWTDEQKPKPGTEEILKTLEFVLRRYPDHAGANHYYIHGLEGSPFPERALMSAERFSHYPLSVSHFLHVPAHIYFLIGHYWDAAEINNKAIKADLYPPDGSKPSYPQHYINVRTVSYEMAGNFKMAYESANIKVDINTLQSQQKEIIENQLTSSYFTLLRFNQWEKMLQTPPPPNEDGYLNLLWHFGRAVSFARLHQLKEAQHENFIFLELLEAWKKEKGEKHGVFLSIAKLVINASIARGQGDDKQAIEELKQAIKLDDQIPYELPPLWYYPMRESLGVLQYKVGDYAQAVATFRQELKRHEGNGRALFGLYHSLQKLGDVDAAIWAQKEYIANWKHSDIKLNLEEL